MENNKENKRDNNTQDNTEKLNNTIKAVFNVLEKHKNNPNIKLQYEKIKNLKEKRNI